MKTIRISKFSNPARGGRMVEMRTAYGRSCVMQPGGLCFETTKEVWMDVGTLMEPIENHVEEQPKSLAHKLMLRRLHAA